jgi:UDPglucose 6-dehydrogenase
MESDGPASRPRTSRIVTMGSIDGTSAEPIPLRHPNGLRRIAVIGTGYVGLVTGTCLAQLGNSVVCLDNDRSKIAMLQRGELPFFEPQLLELIVSNRRAGRLSFSEDVAAGVRSAAIVFVAVGTPMRHDASADLSAVWDVAGTIARELNGPKVVVLKSTVPVETTEIVAAIVAENAANPYHVEVVSNPEFLREGSAVADFMHPSRIIIGTNSRRAQAIMRDLYSPLQAPFVITDLRTSEMIKYAANAFLATKVSFMNEIANICELVDVDVKVLGDAIGLDHRIGTHHMNPGIGYGGSCFPKDVRALERTARDRGYDAVVLRSVDSVNRMQVRRAFAKIERALGGSVEGKTVCVLGLAFKPNTSDVREAPALDLMNLLLRSGAAVAAHDPVAIESARAATAAGIRYCSEMYEAMSGCDALALLTEWNEYEHIDFGTARKLMRGDVVFDGRNMFDAEKVVAEGLRYVGIGRAKEPALIAEHSEAHAV